MDQVYHRYVHTYYQREYQVDYIHLQPSACMTMTKVTQLEDRGAAVAWSPIASHADYLALGAKVCICVIYRAFNALLIRWHCWPRDTTRLLHRHAVSCHSLGCVQ